METRRLPDGTVTLLFTDVEGSTRLLQELGREAYVEALTTHRRLLREAVASHGGVEVEMQGDSFHFAFRSARDAVAAAAAGQEALQSRGESQPIRVRMGLHTGEPMQADGLYAGLDVHRAARIMSAAHGGQVLLSDRTAELVSGITLVDLGEHRLKDLTAPQRLHQVGDAEFPRLNTLSARTSLPVASSSLIGRESELAELTRLLVDGVRVVTVTGTGGTGKTRLALQAAAEVVERFPDGVHWVPLGALTDAALVVPAIATAVGVTDGLEDALANRRTLLLLDNFEHVLGAAAAVSALLASARDTKALVTSRSPLQIAGEHEFALDPLADDAALTLFVERSRGAGRDVGPDEPVLEICRRLDNLPLAIELAAARSKLLAPEALLGRLEHRLPLLTGGRRDAPERQQTLRATIDWSHALLDEPTQLLFARLTVFAGSFSLEAAEAVCEADLDALQALVDLSLLKSLGDGRFLMLETIREYGAERLAALSLENEVRRRHAEWFGALAYAQSKPARESRPEAFEILERDEPNLRAAIANAVALQLSEAAQRLLAGLWLFLSLRGHNEELERWAHQVLGLPAGDDDQLYAEALCFGSEVFRFRGDHAAARRYKEQALPLLRKAGLDSLLAATLTDLAAMTAVEGAFDEAERLAHEALAIRTRIGTEGGIAHAKAALGEIAFWRADYEQAIEVWEETLPTWRKLGAHMDVANALVAIGACLRRLGALDEASARLLEGLDLSSEMDDVILIAETVRELAAVAISRGDHRAASVLLGAHERLVEESGIPVYDPADYEAIVLRLREALGEDELAQLWAYGAGLKRGDLIDAARSSVQAP